MAGAVNRGRGLCFEESATGAFFDRLYFASAKRVFFASATFDVTAPLLSIHLRRESRQVTAVCVLKTPSCVHRNAHMLNVHSYICCSCIHMNAHMSNVHSYIC